mmetsp:Transcript_4136/g.14450  ORF Transcript_4136/g.14450 Transcript_4136/m.14450 type:complete len:234 (-) Transcript_4136:82-783(-)
MAAFDANPISLALGDAEVSQWANVTSRETQRTREGRRRPRRGEGGRGSGASATGASERELAREARREETTRAAAEERRAVRPLSHITLADLQRKAVTWQEFGGGERRPWRSFSIPRSQKELEARVTDNVYHFVGNYRQCCLFCLFAVLYKRPLALFGAVAMALLWDWLERAHPTSADRSSRAYLAKEVSVKVACALIGMVLSVSTAVVSWFCTSMALCLLHAALKVPAHLTQT